ncbi:hypothetical protein TR51_17380 [Kitasatospora griseola]|uniref:Uncharacterized protein n=1 Tax=Kitasatospora griseola TaxID=2064 RepID=A0A0D0Q3S3_KITGR|nr:hypothetical protein TR51_17380 [Kitasatospora griseola]
MGPGRSGPDHPVSKESSCDASQPCSAPSPPRPPWPSPPPDAASAATGTLFIAPNQTIENPSGCYNAQIFPLILRNETNEYALVYDGSNCTGQVIAVVPPGGSTTQEFGQSVYIA